MSGAISRIFEPLIVHQEFTELFLFFLRQVHMVASQTGLTFAYSTFLYGSREQNWDERRVWKWETCACVLRNACGLRATGSLDPRAQKMAESERALGGREKSPEIFEMKYKSFYCARAGQHFNCTRSRKRFLPNLIYFSKMKVNQNY